MQCRYAATVPEFVITGRRKSANFPFSRLRGQVDVESNRLFAIDDIGF
jgi:hypothetical protein